MRGSIKRQTGLPVPRSYPLLGHLPEFLRDKLGFLSMCAAQHGDVVKLKIGRPTLLLNSPDDIEHVLMTKAWNYDKTPRLTSVRAKRISGEGLMTSQGEAHLKQRRMLQPVFYRKAIEVHSGVIATSVEHMLTEWKSGDELDIASEMTRLSQGIMFKALFGPNFKDESGELARAISMRRRFFEDTLSSIFPFPEYLPTHTARKHRQAIKKIDDVVYRAIQMRLESTGLSNDLLSKLIKARYEDGIGMSDKQVRDEALTFLTSGYETIGAALAWTFYLLSQYPETELKLVAELYEVLNGRPLCADDLSKLHYADMVLSESMRLYPPTWMVVRMARHSDILPSGTAVRAGSKLYLCQYVMHRQSRYFPQPERFDPERFGHASKQCRPRFAYFPFGGGPHRCIGETFAKMECILVLTSIVRRFKLTLPPGQVVVPEAGIFLRPKNGIRMRVEHR